MKPDGYRQTKRASNASFNRRIPADLTAKGLSANLKGIGEGIKKNAETTAANAAKGAIKGTIEGVKETLPFKKVRPGTKGESGETK